MNQPTQPPAAPAPAATPPAPPAAAAPVVARVAKIALSDYRAFPAGQTYEFNLGPEGKNLLLFGENGSGKTSLFRALRDLMSEVPGTMQFGDRRHIYAPSEEGFVSLQLTAGTPSDFRWDYGEDHPSVTGGAPFRLVASRCRFLDYKALLKTSHAHEDAACVNLFDLLVRALVTEAEFPDGRTVGRSWEELLHHVPTPPPPHVNDEEYEPWPTPLKQVREKARDFRSLLTELLNARRTGIVSLANAFLRQLSPGLRIRLNVESFRVERVSHEPATTSHGIVSPSIRLNATYCGRRIEHPAVFFNEGRLTAISLAIYLAAAKATIPDAEGAAVPRLLVLDDVLIGLDLSNRLPVLKVLTRDFADWQIILMTYDRLWFDLAKEYTEHSGRWVWMKLRALDTGPGRPVRPDVVSANADLVAEYLNMADKHIRDDDLMAAAVYTRAAFETRVKNICRKCGVEVAYEPDPKRMKVNDLWEAIMARQRKRETDGKSDFIPASLMSEIESVRSTILNRLSHSGTPTFEKLEVQLALDTMKKLRQHEFPRDDDR